MIFGDMIAEALAGTLVGFTGDMVATGLNNDANLQAVRETNETNAKNVAATNEANLEQVRLTNAANIEQANLAYQRSLPANQVRDLIDAGMSKAGALNKLAGGGVYTPPALQAGTSQASTAQAPHFDYSGIAQAFERLGSLPANQIQLQYNREQLNALRDEMQMKKDAARREQEKHEYDMWREQYGKDTAQILDAVSSRVSNALLQSGKEIGDFKSFESLIRGLDLQDDKDIKRLPHLARTQLYDSISQKFADERARQQQQNNNRSADDAHDIAVKHKVQLQQAIDDFEAAKDARELEYAEREFKARLGALFAEFGIAEQEALESIKAYRGKDGKLHMKPETKIPETMSTVWDAIFSIIPIESLSRILLSGLKK